MIVLKKKFHIFRRLPALLMTGLLSAVLLLTAPACGEDEPTYADRETFAQETYTAVSGGKMSLRDGLAVADYPSDTYVAEWLAGCSAPDRDEQFDAYTLRHSAPTADGNTTFTYIIYYPHGGAPLSVSPELLEGESGYVLNLTYGAGQGTDGYSLCALTVTLPTEKAPRLRLLTEKDILGVMSTVTDTPISAAP